MAVFHAVYNFKTHWELNSHCMSDSQQNSEQRKNNEKDILVFFCQEKFKNLYSMNPQVTVMITDNPKLSISEKNLDLRHFCLGKRLNVHFR